MHEKEIQKNISDLKSDDPEIRLKAAKNLGSLGPAAGEAAAALIGLLGDIWIQTTVIWALREMKEGVKSGLVELIESLKSEDEFVRKSAAELLGNAGREAEPSILNLLKIYKEDPVNEIREIARESIFRIDPDQEI